MTPNEYIEKNYYSLKNEFHKIANNDKSSIVDDFFHDCLEIFLRHKKAQQVVDNNTARFFLARIGLNQWRSNRSDFHFTYRLPLQDLSNSLDVADTEYDITEDVMIDVMMQSLDEMFKDETTKYKSMLIIIYHSLGSNYSEVERQFNIPRTTVRLHYKEGLEILNNLIKSNLNKLDNGEFRLSEDLNSFVTDWCNNIGSDEQQALSMASNLFKSKYFKPA